MLNIRTFILSIALVVILMLTVGLVTARTEVVSDPSSDSAAPASVFNNQEQSANQNKAPIPSYRSPLDECFDVPLRDATGCHNASQRFSNQELKDVLNSRYEHRCCGLPR